MNPLQLHEGTKAELFLILDQNHSCQAANTSGTLQAANIGLAPKNLVERGNPGPVVNEAQVP